jgi:hypothetical protein
MMPTFSNARPSGSTTSSSGHNALIPSLCLFNWTISPPRLDRVKAAAFLGLLTSPGNYQAWVAVSNPDDADFARHLRKGQGPTRPRAGDAHRRQPELQGKIFARLLLRQDRAYYPWPAPRSSSPDWDWSRWSRNPAPCRLDFFHTPRQQEMAELPALRRGCAAQSRKHRPRHQPCRLHVVHDGD